MTHLWNLESFEEIINWFNTNPRTILEPSLYKSNYSNKMASCIDPEDFHFEITLLDLGWGPGISNSHHCPRNGVKNWGGRGVFPDGSPMPRGYPGWYGKIEFTKSHKAGWTSDILKPFLFHTGTGSGGGVSHPASYEVFIYEADWPGLASRMKPLLDAYNSERVMRLLKNEPMPSFRQEFYYRKMIIPKLELT